MNFLIKNKILWVYIMLQYIFFLISVVTIFTVTQEAFSSNLANNEIIPWVLIGGLKSTEVSFRVRYRSKDPKEFNHIFYVVTDSDSIVHYSILESWPETLPGTNSNTYPVTITNLEPNQSYRYGLIRVDTGEVQVLSTLEAEMKNKRNPIYDGTFHTPAPEGERFNFTIAISGCALTGSNSRIFQHILSPERNKSHPPPLVFLHAGDFHYEDLSTIDYSERMEAIDKVLNSPAQRALYSNTPLVYMWDDHDWLGNDSLGTQAATQAASQAATRRRLQALPREVALVSYRDAFPHYEPLPGAAGPESVFISPYQAFTIGTVRFIITDLRSESTLMHTYSDFQKSWFFDELRNSTQYDYVVWLSTKPWIGPDEEGKDDSWSGYPSDRQELSNHITEVVTKGNLIVVSADAHMVGFDDGKNTYFGSDKDPATTSFPLLQSGPLDKLGSIKGGPYSHGCHTIEYERNHQYSTISFEFVEQRKENNNTTTLTSTIDDDPFSMCLHIKSYSVRDDIWREKDQLLLSEKICGSLFQKGPLKNSTLEGKSSSNDETIPLLSLGSACKSRRFTSFTTVVISISILMFALNLLLFYRFRKMAIITNQNRSETNSICRCKCNNEVTDNIAIAFINFFSTFILIILSTGLPVAMNAKSAEPAISFSITSIQSIVSFIYILFWRWKTP